MRHIVRKKAVSRFVLLLAIAPSLQEARAHEGRGQSTPNNGQERILVLQDGGVLAGRIEREGDRFIVCRAGGQIRVPAANVLFECGSLSEAHKHRRQQITRPTAEAHLALAEWCLRYDLVAEARRELAEAQALDPRHPRLALLDRRLAHASQASRQQAVAEAATKPGTSTVATPAQPRAAASEVPVGVVERFTRKVQPVLVNNCTASGCHQPGGAQQFQLDRSLLHGLANRRSTMNNLTATLALVDRERPQLSPLLTVPRRAHGGRDEPIFGPRQEQAFQHLVEWVAQVTRADPSKSPASMSSNVDADFPAPREQADGGEIDLGLDPPSGLRFGAQVERWQPRDPFDPEIFNRQRPARRRSASLEESHARPADR